MGVDVSQSIVKINLLIGLNPGKPVRHSLNFDTSGCPLQNYRLIFDLHGLFLRLRLIEHLECLLIFGHQVKQDSVAEDRGRGQKTDSSFGLIGESQWDGKCFPDATLWCKYKTEIVIVAAESPCHKPIETGGSGFQPRFIHD
jgi:hypothetical protein